MRKNLALLVILVYAAILRLYQIDKIPPLISKISLQGRYISALFSIGSIVLVYLYAQRLFHQRKLAIISAWVLSVLPWTIEQGRIVSQVNNALFFFLICLILATQSRYLSIKLMIYFLIIPGLYFIYPEFWLFHTKSYLLPVSSFMNNIFILTSPDFFLFKNITFWWGGVREVGIVHPVFLLFLMIGIYKIVIERKINMIFWIGLILALSAASPFFPESREFFLVAPFLSILIALGINELLSRRDNIWHLAYFFVFAFIIYDLAQFWHYYIVHYPQQVSIKYP